MYLKSEHENDYKNYINELDDIIKKGHNITDTHSHIHFPEYTADFEVMLARAKSCGVNRIITIGINYEDSLKAQDLSKKYSEVYFTAGVHPSEVDSFHEMDLFEPLLIDEKCVAIGEVGLDYYRNASNKEFQKSVFKKFLSRSLYLKKPVVIHSRDATPELLSILDDFTKHNILKGVFHCFSGDEDLLKWGVEHDFYFSFTGNITFPKSYKLRSSLKFIPENRILLETDCPYLTPMPFRGKRNEPSYIIYTLYTAYKIKTMSLQSFVSLLEENVRDFFNL